MQTEHIYINSPAYQEYLEQQRRLAEEREFDLRQFLLKDREEYEAHLEDWNA